MRVRLIRHATLLVETGGRRLLVDPMLDEPEARPPVLNTANERRNPLVPLPLPIAQIVDGLDAVLVTHLHEDHLDEAAIRALPPSLPLFCQPEDAETLAGRGFTSVLPVDHTALFDGLTIQRTPARHGRGEIGDKMAPASGFVVEAENEPTLYVAGDSVWCDEVAATMRAREPAVTVVNAGAAQFVSGGPITMDAEDVIAAARAEPLKRIVAVHMDAINHCLVRRADLRRSLVGHGLSDAVAVPEDGEVLTFPGLESAR